MRVPDGVPAAGRKPLRQGIGQAMRRLRERDEWKVVGVLPKADRGLAAAWWAVLALRGVLPAVFSIAMGALVGAAQHGAALGGPLALVAGVFILLQVLTPIHQAVGANLGDRTAAWLHDRLAEACVRPPGIAHLEDPKLAGDLTVARDFDLGMTGPPLSLSVDFIASGLVEMIGGLACAVVLAGYRWWAAVLLAGAWLATHWLLRESAAWRDRAREEVRAARRDSDYAYRLAVDPPAAKELRLFGLAGWTLDRFVSRRTRPHELQYQATRLRERPLAWSMALVIGANVAGDGVERLTSGLDTQLGAAWPDGVDVSFGQWQKLALARGFMRNRPLLLVLDEPTAALDAETEHALFERYAAAARRDGFAADGRITILVSHRFSTVRMADLIVVLHGARRRGRHPRGAARQARAVRGALRRPGRGLSMVGAQAPGAAATAI